MKFLTSTRSQLRPHLDSVEAGGAVVAPDAVEDSLNVAELVCGPPAVHAGDRLPTVPPGTELLSRL